MAPKLTNPLRPVARYRKGQAPANAVASDSDSDDEQQQQEEEEEQLKAEQSEDEKPNVGAGRGAGSGRINVALRQVEVDSKGQVKVGGREEVGRTVQEQGEGSSSEYETDSEDEKPPKPVFKPKMPKAESEEGSSEYETDSEEEAPAPIYKPVFVSKRNRDTIAERDAALDPEVIEARRLAELEERKKQSHDLVADSILRELASKDAEQAFPDVDDTDGLDPTAEFEEWKLRELMRIKRDKEALYAREKEREEVEARRALPETLRLKEDTERAKKSREEKQKGNQVFMQKYHHKGAFYTDSEVLKKHDYSAPTASTVRDMASLPKAMQVRNFGKASQSKYTHLAAEDTTKGDAGWAKKTGAAGGAAGGCFACGGPHLKRDCPQLANAGPSGSNGSAMGGAEGGPSRERDGGWGSRPPPRRDDERDGGDRYARPPPPRERERERLDYGGRGERERRDDRGYGRDERDRDGRYGSSRGGGGGGGYYRDERRRSRSRSKSPPPRRRDERDDRDRDEKRRRVD
ncbi:splicing factor, Prp19-binding domain-domain-containing protein [Leucosporidium creatinivorum]|uniref:Splicing factor, Prp19-binding domain-domain-containing protein n=1 Tax=Leucosporidium creatinivorum TaxID=106004 RepID=A0A1Y2CP60_9BASI|nr:splicing factor, Prp19-binding domain-domain-containing protein [Leucosporidium creatinivorum]